MGLKFKLMCLLLVIICTPFCTDVVLASTIDVNVYYNGSPVYQAIVYDNGNTVGQTNIDGVLNNIHVDQGFHKVVAKWRDDTGQERSGERSLVAPPNSNTWLRIDLI
jgi:hypothetical protein